MPEPPVELDALASEIVDAVGEVRRELGAGLLEDPYVEALGFELELRGIPFERARPVPVFYKGRELRKRYFPDFIIADRIVLEAKAVPALQPLHHAQLLTYLRHTHKPLGFLVNFNAIPLRDGICRKVNGRIIA